MEPEKNSAFSMFQLSVVQDLFMPPYHEISQVCDQQRRQPYYTVVTMDMSKQKIKSYVHILM